MMKQVSLLKIEKIINISHKMTLTQQLKQNVAGMIRNRNQIYIFPNRYY